MNLLVVDDDRLTREALVARLSALGHTVEPHADAAGALAHFQPGRFEVVLADVSLVGVDGLTLLVALLQRSPRQEVIGLTRAADLTFAIETLRSGAGDLLLLPCDDAALALAIERATVRIERAREHAALLSDHHAQLRREAMVRRCLELASLLDPEVLHARLLGDLCGLADSPLGALWVLDDRGDLVLRAYRGLAHRARLPTRISPHAEPLASLLSHRRPFPVPTQTRDTYVPFIAQGEAHGLCLIGERPRGALEAEELEALQATAELLTPALRHGQHLVRLQQRALRDRDTGAYHLAAFVDHASKEAYRARRYGRAFTLMTWAVSGPERLIGRHGPEGLRRALRSVVSALHKVSRDADVVARAGESELYVLLPETDHFGATAFARRARDAMGAEPHLAELEAEFGFAMDWGAATYPVDGDEFDSLTHHARARMEASRHSLVRQLMLEDLDFWSTLDLLLGQPGGPRLPGEDRAGPSRRASLPDALFGRAQVEAARELARDPGARGLLYLGLPEISATLPLLSELEQRTDTTGRAYVLGRRAGLDAHPAATLVYLEGDERIQAHEFLLLHAEHASYAVLRRRGEPHTFHTSDPRLVDALVAKLQLTYDLQPL